MDPHEEIQQHIRGLIETTRRARAEDVLRLREAIEHGASDRDVLELCADIQEWTRAMRGYEAVLTGHLRVVAS